MKIFPILIVCFWVTDGVRNEAESSSNGSTVVLMGLTTVVRRVDPRFLSVTIDASLAADESFMLLLRSQKIQILTKALSPAFLRFGGTTQDFMVFTPQELDAELLTEESCSRQLPLEVEKQLKEDWIHQQLILSREEMQRKYHRVQFSELTVDLLNSFARCTGMDLIFGLNALLRTADNSWNSSNAHTLLQYCESKQYNMSWELGNEPNSFEKKAGIRVDGDQLGQDFTHLRKIMSKSKLYSKAGLYGPDVGQPRDHKTDLLGSYYVNGRDTSLEDFLDPEVLDTLTLKTNEVLETVKQASPGKSVWLGETSSAYGGGASGLSDTFVAGFMWLDKLGLGARLGLDVVMRQVLVGFGSYHLIDKDLNPLPDYWLSVLYKKLVGPEVLKIDTTSNFVGNKRLRLYLHCANKKSYRSSAVVLMAMNLSKTTRKILVPALVSSSTVDVFVLQSDHPGEEGLYSRSVKLNEELLKMVDDKTLPSLHGVHQPPAKHLQVPGFSLAFFVFVDAKASACR